MYCDSVTTVLEKKSIGIGNHQTMMDHFNHKSWLRLCVLVSTLSYAAVCQLVVVGGCKSLALGLLLIYDVEPMKTVGI